MCLVLRDRDAMPSGTRWGSPFIPSVLWPRLLGRLHHPCWEAESWRGPKRNILWLRCLEIHLFAGRCLWRGCGSTGGMGGVWRGVVGVLAAERGESAMTTCVLVLESLKSLFLANCFLRCRPSDFCHCQAD